MLSNDHDIDGPSLRALLVRGPEHGSLVLSQDEAFVYSPAPGFAGEDSFVYQASDTQLVSADTLVTLVVSAPLVQLRLEADANYFGLDSFTYQLVDVNGVSDTAIVKLDIQNLRRKHLGGRQDRSTSSRERIGTVCSGSRSSASSAG